jgi:glycosyltransferase involved in cell wall biosynthesis
MRAVHVHGGAPPADCAAPPRPARDAETEITVITPPAARRDLARASTSAVLLSVTRGAPGEAALEAALASLRSQPHVSGVVWLDVPASGLGLLGDLALRPDAVRALLMRTALAEACAVMLDPPLADGGPPPLDGPLACAWLVLCAAASGALQRGHTLETDGAADGAVRADRWRRHDQRGPLETDGAVPPAELSRYLARAIRALAVDDVFAALRVPGCTLDRSSALLEWSARALERRPVVEAFALGAHAMALAEQRDEGLGLRVSLAEPAHAGAHPPRVASHAEPCVSLIVPTHRRPALLARALESIAAQLYTDLEVILVDDAGHDAHAVIEASRARLGERVRLTAVEHGMNRGLAAARNTGLRLARGRFVGFLDDDDRLLPGHLAALVPHLLSGARAAHSDVRMMCENAVPGRSLPVTQACVGRYDRGVAPLLLALDNQLPVNAVLCERSLLLDAGGFDETLPVLEDWDLWLRVLLRVPPVHVPRVTAEVRVRRDGTRMTDARTADWPLTMARIYARTLALERGTRPLREMRARYLADRCSERGLPFPAFEPWLRPGDLPPIDPADPRRPLVAPTS